MAHDACHEFVHHLVLGGLHHFMLHVHVVAVVLGGGEVIEAHPGIHAPVVGDAIEGDVILVGGNADGCGLLFRGEGPAEFGFEA